MPIRFSAASSALQNHAQGIREWLPTLYLLWALPFLFVMAAVIPPNGHADELEHFYYAARIADGNLIGTKLNTKAGSYVDPAVRAAIRPFNGTLFRPNVKNTENHFTAGQQLRWSEERVFIPKAGTYPPVLYIPQAIGLKIGQVIDASVLNSFYIARFFNAVTLAAITAFALWLARRTRFALAAIAMLPMTITLNASLSHDGAMIALMLLATGAIDRIIHEDRHASTMEALLIAAVISLVAMAKPPYLILGGLLFLIGPFRSARVWGGVAMVLVFTGVWWFFASKLSTTIRADANAAQQLSMIVSDPLRIFNVAANTMAGAFGGYFRQFIGVLGWLDTRLPVAYEALVAMLTLIMFASALDGRSRKPAVAVVVVLVSIGSVFGLLYLIGSTVGAGAVQNVQGRYFLPIAAAAPLAMPGWGAAGRLLTPLAAAALLLAALVGPAVIMWTFTSRYYLGAG